MDLEVVRAMVDVSGYMGALTAGVAGNAIWDSARSVFERVRAHFSADEHELVSQLTNGAIGRADLDRLLAAVERTLSRTPSMLADTVYAVGPGSSVSNSIIIVNPGDVGDINQSN